jgi:peptidoglycan/xylan/chitin deacetylase (PgdA/CDA1 family)
LFGWDQAHALVARGVEIGGHSRNHPALTTVDAGCMETEVRATLEDLRRELGEGLYTFAYPHGRFDEQTMAAVAAAAVESDDARFSGACCSRGGVNDPYVPLYALRRVEIKGTDSFMSFQLMVRLGRRTTVRQLLRSLFVG